VTPPPATSPGALTFTPEPAFVPLGVAFWDAGHGIAVGTPLGDSGQGPGIVALTGDGGRTWTGGALGATPLIAVSTAADRDAWAISSCAAPVPDGACSTNLIRSSDGGVTWASLGVAARAVSFADAEHGWAAVSDAPGGGLLASPRLVATVDGGASWRPVAQACAAWDDVAAIRFVDRAHGWVVCSGEGSGTMGPNATYETTDAGGTWALRSELLLAGPHIVIGRPPGGPVDGAFFLSSGHGWAWQGRSGTESTVDGGASWKEAPPGRPEEVFVHQMWFVDGDHGFALVFADGATKLWTTADGGATWKAVHRW
jgi:photosystem II stability/assembly factor-like uncharacterized protein